MAHVAHYKMAGVAPMLGHYERRAELERGYRRKNVDPTRTAQNYAIGAGSPQDLAAAVRERVLEARRETEADSGRRLRRDANVLSDWVVTLPRDCPPELARGFFEAAVRFCRDRYGSDNVLGGFVHVDEATPHVHIPVVPVRDGRIRAAKVFTRADLRTFHADLGRAEDAALGMHVSVELDPADKGARQLSHLSQVEYRAAKDELRRADRDVAAARAEAQSWARLSRALGPGGEGADVPQEDGSVRHQDSVGQLVTQRETMRAEAEAQLELARRACQQAGRDREMAARELAEARTEAKEAREAAEAAKAAQRAAEGARAGAELDAERLAGRRDALRGEVADLSAERDSLTGEVGRLRELRTQLVEAIESVADRVYERVLGRWRTEALLPSDMERVTEQEVDAELDRSTGHGYRRHR